MVKKKVAKVLAFRYKVLALIFIILAGGLVLLPKYKKHEGIKPQALLSNVINPERYISTDNLAHKIISKDPSILLIDVRDEKSYANYTIPNALNIPLNKLLDEENEMYLLPPNLDAESLDSMDVMATTIVKHSYHVVNQIVVSVKRTSHTLKRKQRKRKQS